MSLKKIPQSLSKLCLQSMCQAMFHQWRNTYFTNYWGFKAQFHNEFIAKVPFTFVNKIFNGMVDSYVQFMRNESSLTDYQVLLPSIVTLIYSIVSLGLSTLNLQSLQDLGVLEVKESLEMEYMLVSQLQYLHNLVEIDLQSSGWGCSLPICTDKILEVIGSSCFKLCSLDVSHNFDVTDNGLMSLVPSKERRGCCQLFKLSIFECPVTYEGIGMLWKGLPKLKFFGYRETIQSLRFYYFNISPCTPLKLVHLNNLGRVGCRNRFDLQCDSIAVDIISLLCPNVKGLKIRVNDSIVQYLQALTRITILELCFNLGTLSSPGNNTVQYLQLCGAQFVQLSLACKAFSNKYLKVICEHCNNLKQLHLNSRTFNSDRDMTKLDKNKCVLTNLEKFGFRIGSEFSDLISIPSDIFNYVLHKSCVLQTVSLTMKNILMDDIYMQNLFSSIETSKIKTIELGIPCKNSLSPLRMTMMTVEILIGMCPELENLGKLLMWNINTEEVEVLEEHLLLTNTSFNVS